MVPVTDSREIINSNAILASQRNCEIQRRKTVGLLSPVLLSVTDIFGNLLHAVLIQRSWDPDNEVPREWEMLRGVR